MEKHFLATISSEADHLFGVRFICSFFNRLSENRVTLLHICGINSKTKALTSIWESPRDNNSALVSPEVNTSILKAQRLLSDQKVPVNKVLIKTVPEKYGKVKDILIESERGLYDAIVLGRRVSYTLQWMFDRAVDETSQAMLKEHSCVSPLWICPDADPGRKNVLLCIDGTENGYRAVDHVGFMISSQNQHKITLLHVENSVGTECVEYFRRAESILLGHKIAAKHIIPKVVWDSSISGAILSEIKKGNFAVVALGMGGQNQGKGSGRIVGKTTVKLISKLEKTSLWCCP
ncbi:MAG: universal stress protein [Desulforhopalus sp.]